MKYRIFFFLSLLLMPLSAGGLFLAFLSLPTTSLLFCITELFSATASLSAILFFGIGFFQMVKEQNTKSELALLKQQQEVSSIQEQQLSNLQKDTIHNKNPSIIIWKQYKSNPLRAIYRSTFFSGVTLTSSFQK